MKLPRDRTVVIGIGLAIVVATILPQFVSVPAWFPLAFRITVLGMLVVSIGLRAVHMWRTKRHNTTDESGSSFDPIADKLQR